MTTERFSKKDFEDVLTDILEDHGKKWSCLGLRGGEYRYAVQISKFAYMLVNSSVGADDYAAGTGDNSIRVWLVDHGDNSLGSKTQCWIDRRPHWQDRLAKAIDTTISMGSAIQYCQHCATVEKVFIVKKDGPNKGRMFIKCMCEHSFSWLDITEHDPSEQPSIVTAPSRGFGEGDDDQTAKIVIPSCPLCGAKMIARNRKSDGAKFWGCSKFPSCMGTRQYTEDFNEKWIEYKNKFAEREAEQERAAFASDTDYQKSMENGGRKDVLAAVQKAAGLKAADGHVWSIEQTAFFDTVKSLNPGENVVLLSGAGTGKTTTIAQSTRLLPRNKRILVVVFNKHNVQPVKDKVPEHVQVRTYNSLGFAGCRKAFNISYKDVDDKGKKMNGLLENVLDKNTWRYVYPAIRQLVSLVKANLTGTTDEDLAEIADYYGIELNGDAPVVFQAVREIIERSKSMTKFVDFDDQCWLPVVHNAVIDKYDYIYVDEAQDTNRCQIALILASVADDGHIIAVGDENQSMYAFRGADAQAMPNLIESLDAKVMRLSKTFRNPECIVQLVNQKMPHIQFTGTGKLGTISNISYENALVAYKAGDMVLCRTNAPLVAPVFDLIRHGVKATIRGRDIGKGLLSFMRKMKASDVQDLIVKMNDYQSIEVPKLIVAEKDVQAQNLIDKIETIIALSDGLVALFDLENRITSIFDDKIEGVVFSTIHRAKGLEAETVYILGPDLLPHPMAKREWEKHQEVNIEYVALTRTLCNLVYVPQKQGKK